MIPQHFLTFARKANIRSVKCIASSLVRNQSTATSELVLVDVNDKTGYATVSLNKAPVNSLNLELLTAISTTLDDLKNNKTRGMILTSSQKTVFSAGLDINEMYKPDHKRMREFWSALQDTWLKLYGAPFATAAAINGHSPAGGCLLAMCCEYRVMLPKYTIGLNETKLGIVAPAWFMATMKNTISLRQAEMALTLGTLFKTDEALKIGLIDDIAADKAEAIAKCEAFLDRYKKIPPMARALTKQSLRSKDLQQLQNNKEADIDMFASFIVGKNIQKSLGLYVTVMKVRKMFKSFTKPFTSIAKLFGGKPKIKK